MTRGYVYAKIGAISNPVFVGLESGDIPVNLIDVKGNGYNGVNHVSVRKCGSTYGYELMIELAGGRKPLCIGYASPGEDILPEVKDLITSHMVRNVELLDLREHFEPETEYFGWYGCTILKKGSRRT